MIQEKPDLVLHEPPATGQVAWRSPSNLAIIKYWGKHGIQLPRNPSLSLTLRNSFTETKISYEKRERGGISTEFTFAGKANPEFKKRIDLFLDSIKGYLPFINQLHLKISSHNSFPHSSGIASSASSMSAFALCLCDIERQLFDSFDNDSDFLHKASYLSRLGSGSACRSVYPQAAIWGQHPEISRSSDDYAIAWGSEVHQVFHTFHDDILIVSPHEKSVSSSAGHKLMEGNVYASARYLQAKDRTLELTNIMEAGDVEAFGKIAEDEAMTLHALMMCSDPSYMLIEPGSVAIMKEVRVFRQDTSIPVYFSLDAGPNIHLLYPDAYADKVTAWINETLISHCHNDRVIKDGVGNGPKKLLVDA